MIAYGLLLVKIFRRSSKFAEFSGRNSANLDFFNINTAILAILRSPVPNYFNVTKQQK